MVWELELEQDLGDKGGESLGDFPDSSVGKESACNAGDPSSIPGLGRSAGEGIGCPVQYSWASLVAQLIKNPPTMWETWVWSLGWEIPWKRERLPTPVFWPGEFIQSMGSIQSIGSQRVGHDGMTFTFHYQSLLLACPTLLKTATLSRHSVNHLEICHTVRARASKRLQIHSQF